MDDTESEPPDEELLQRMRRKSEDPVSAAKAFTVFYVRHVQFLYRCVASADARLVGCALGAADIVEECFTKVWESAADTFTLPEGLAPEAASRSCKAWLSKIACNLLKDKLRSRKKVFPIDPGGENQGLFAEPAVAESVERCVRMQQVVARTLNERDAAIVWFKIGYYDPETGQSQPPSDAQAAFCREWNLTPAALRKAYERALSAISGAYTSAAQLH